ncbi:hypothetical protein ACGFMO_20850 [Streptomyces niveus]|uniref:hypothetical protein n=1 Tax=Streptomyces niveus TaxID=193462 RepID=UPI0037196C0E
MPIRQDPAVRSLPIATFTVLRRHRRALVGTTTRVVGLAGLGWLVLVGAVFGLAWSVFTRMRNQRVWYQYLEDPYLHDSTDLRLVTLCALPLFLLLLGVGSAAIQNACSLAVGAAAANRLRPVLGVYALRALIVWPLPLIVAKVADSFTGYHLDTPLPLERGTWPYVLVKYSPLAALFVAVLLRLALTLAPAAAADGLSPRAAIARSWSLTWTRAGAARVFALAVPLAVLTAGSLRLVTQLALPLRPFVRGLLEDATGNFFAAYYAGILAPVIVGILVTAAATVPLACTGFAVLHDRLRAPRATP